MLKWLIHEGFLHSVGNRGVAFVPAKDFSRIPVKEVLDAIEDQGRRIPTVPDDFTRDYVASLMKKQRGNNMFDPEEITFEMMVSDVDEGDFRTARVEAVV